MSKEKGFYALAVTRIFLGLIFLWAFFDKLLGLGFATKPASAWISGGSPTQYFLSKVVYGPLAPFYNSISGSTIVAWLFMIGLLVIGIGLTLGIATRFSSYAGVVMLLLMWSSMLPPANNPVIDDHIIYAIILIAIATLDIGKIWGLQEKWESLKLVKKISILK